MKKNASDKKSKVSVKSCFGHLKGTQSEIFDNMFKKGAKIKEIAQKVNCSESRVLRHLAHLKQNGRIDRAFAILQIKKYKNSKVKVTLVKVKKSKAIETATV